MLTKDALYKLAERVNLENPWNQCAALADRFELSERDVEELVSLVASRLREQPAAPEGNEIDSEDMRELADDRTIAEAEMLLQRLNSEGWANGHEHGAVYYALELLRTILERSQGEPIRPF